MGDGRRPLWATVWKSDAADKMLAFVWENNLSSNKYFEMFDEIYYQLRHMGGEVVTCEVVKRSLPKYI